MSYRAQLVVRTVLQEDAELIDEIRTLAHSRGETISSVAVEYLRLGKKLLEKGVSVDSLLAAEQARAEGHGDSSEITSRTSTDLSDDQDDEAGVESAASSDDGGKGGKSLDEKPAGRDVTRQVKRSKRRGSSSKHHDIVEEVVEFFETKGVDVAARYLSEQYKGLNAVKGAALRGAVKSRFTLAEAETLYKAALKYDDYRAYQERILYGSDAV